MSDDRDLIRIGYRWLETVAGFKIAQRALQVYGGGARHWKNVPEKHLEQCAARFALFMIPTLPAFPPERSQPVTVTGQTAADIQRLKFDMQALKRKQKMKELINWLHNADWDWAYEYKDPLKKADEAEAYLEKFEKDFIALDKTQAVAAGYDKKWVMANWDKPDEVTWPDGEREYIAKLRSTAEDYKREYKAAVTDLESTFKANMAALGVDIDNYAQYCRWAFLKMTVGDWRDPCPRGLAELDFILNGAKKKASVSRAKEILEQV